MYWPYLYSKLNEVSAVLDVAPSIASTRLVVPILHPAADLATLEGRLKRVLTNGLRVAVFCSSRGVDFSRGMEPTKRADRAEQYETPEYREIIARVAANVRHLRDASGMTQEQAAERCGGMPPRLYQMVESGKTNVTATTLGRLCAGFGVDVVALLAPAAPMAKTKPGRPRKAAE